MPVEIGWKAGKRLLGVRYHGKITADDVRRLTEQMGKIVKEGTAPIHVVIDASGVSGVGIGLGDLRSLSTPNFPEIGWMAIIAPNAVYRFFISIGVQFSRGKYKFVNSVDEAERFLVEQDSTLEDVLET
ncbi:MAG: hypothetical protein H3C32_10370 [Anaerolineae bacterium]|nr:hypothetical protein [Anaerolineae bacterium]